MKMKTICPLSFGQWPDQFGRTNAPFFSLVLLKRQHGYRQSCASMKRENEKKKPNPLLILLHINIKLRGY